MKSFFDYLVTFLAVFAIVSVATGGNKFFHPKWPSGVSHPTSIEMLSARGAIDTLLMKYPVVAALSSSMGRDRLVIDLLELR